MEVGHYRKTLLAAGLAVAVALLAGHLLQFTLYQTVALALLVLGALFMALAVAGPLAAERPLRWSGATTSATGVALALHAFEVASPPVVGGAAVLLACLVVAAWWREGPTQRVR